MRLRHLLIHGLAGLAVLAALGSTPASAQDRVYLSKRDIEQTLIGKAIVSRNLVSGRLSHWEFHADGSVHAANRSGPGSASGTWTLQSDGRMCVSMVARTGCRYWYRQGNAIANADSNAPDAPTVAEVRFE